MAFIERFNPASKINRWREARSLNKGFRLIIEKYDLGSVDFVRETPWLDLPRMNEQAQKDFPWLCFFAFRKVFSQHVKDEYWTTGRLKKGMDEDLGRSNKRHLRSLTLAASEFVVAELVGMQLIEIRGEQDILIPLAPEKEFRPKQDRISMANSYEYLAFLGEMAYIDSREVESFRKTAESYRR